MVFNAASNIDADREGIIILEGKYQNKNIFVSNAFGGQGFGYCTYEIRVNGDLVTEDINSSAFEIDLNNFKFELGDAVIIEIRHKSGCTPKVINPVKKKLYDCVTKNPKIVNIITNLVIALTFSLLVIFFVGQKLLI